MQDQLLTELGAKLVEGSLTDEALLVETEAHPVLSILPDANVIKIGGQSLIDRGRTAVFPRAGRADGAHGGAHRDPG